MSYRATHSGVGSTVKIHAADCHLAEETNQRHAWELRGHNLADAIHDADESEQLTERGWKIVVCPCAKKASEGES